MVWIVVSIAGLFVETSLIVLLGRRVTGPYEEGIDLGDGYPVRRPLV